MLVLAWMLLALGCLKVFGLMEQNPYFRLSNPIFPFVTNATVRFCEALLEIGIGLMILRTKRYIAGALLVVWLTCGFFL
jgi:hypothetical protein